MSFWNSTLIKSGRRAYICEPCGREIPTGASSYSESGLFEGDFHSYRLCLPCRAFVERQFESGNLERGEPFEWDWLPDIAREAGELWPPVPAPIEAFGRDTAEWLDPEGTKAGNSSQISSGSEHP